MNLHNRTIRAAIFDMDGTMFDTERLRMQALQKRLMAKTTPISQSAAVPMSWNWNRYEKMAFPSKMVSLKSSRD